MAKIDEQTLVEHLSEFRKRLIVTIIFFIAAFLVSLLFCSDIYKLLTASFKQKLTVLGPNDILSIYLMLAGICAFSLTLPFTSYQLWAFIRPALKEKEAKAILSYVPATFILFVIGLSFGFFVVTPALLNVLLSFGNDLFNIQLTANNYLTFVLHTSLPLAVIFELPVIVAFLTSLHILTPQYLIKNRRYGYFILLVVAVVLTPADFISDLTMAAPLILLYEVSISVCKYVYKRRRDDIGAPGLIVLILGALLIFGPKRLPELGEAIGKMIREFKKSVSGIDSEADDKNVEDKKEKKCK